MESATSYKARLRAKRQLTLPDEVSEILQASEGDDLVFFVNDEGQIVVGKQQTIPPDQAWFWTDRWQKLERESQADIDAGRVHRFDNVDDAVNSLEVLVDAEDRNIGDVQ